MSDPLPSLAGRLPDIPLTPGPLSAQALKAGLPTFHALCLAVQGLPYGRLKGDWRQVLHEKKGTCSSKHAYLAEIAAEQGLGVDLVIAVYAMDGRNTPGVGAVLAEAGLAFIPEAHCFLRFEGDAVDLTTARNEAMTPPLPILAEETVRPHQIGAWKAAYHRRFLTSWLREGAAPGWDLERLWAAREACIAALSAGG